MVIIGLEFRVENDRDVRANPHYRDIIRKHHRRSGFGTKGLDIGLYPGGHEAEQSEEEHWGFIGEGFQNPVKGFVDASVPGLHICIVGIFGGYSPGSCAVLWGGGIRRMERSSSWYAPRRVDCTSMTPTRRPRVSMGTASSVRTASNGGEVAIVQEHVGDKDGFLFLLSII